MQKKAYRKSSKLISLLLTAILVCCILPINVFAEDETVSLSAQAPAKELNNIEEYNSEVPLLTEDNFTSSEKNVQAIADDEETSTDEEVTDEMAGSEEAPPVIQADIAKAFASSRSATVKVVFDLEDGTYNRFYEATVPVGGEITDKPADPTRAGYLFKGWYSYLDENYEPIMWDFEHDVVEENMVLWASWEETRSVFYDLNDGMSTEYHESVVPVGGKITDRPADPTRPGYLFKGWYSHSDANYEPVLWDFENNTVDTTMSLWASWEETRSVFYDLNDGMSTEYHESVVPVGGKITDRPADPIRPGYLFKGWHSHLDANYEPVLWDFENNTVDTTMSLWASWEETRSVFYDLNDGMSTEYHESVVPVGGKITDRPADPIRPGYLFKGWHSHLDANYEPVLWDFENNTVDTTMSLWASWEETRSVFYDLNDGMSTEYNESVVPIGGKITDRPADPTRPGYLFKGWYSYLDENYEPVLWDFDNNTVAANMSLWASWKEESDGSNNSGGNSGEGNSSSGGNNTEGNNSGSGNNTEGNNSNSGNSSGGGNSKGDGGRNETTTAGKSDKKGDAYGSSESVDIDEREVPKSSDTSNNSENLYIVKQEVPKDGMANLPKTGEDCTSQILHAALTLISLFVIFACLIYRKKTI
jgi:uncharacterized repeat protein (TIGR02543 family)